jgi:nitroreductase
VETTPLLQKHETLDAIQQRRSIGKLLPDRPPRDLIEQILEAATWAPCHHVTDPWRFVVLAGAAREELGEIMARSQAHGRDLSDEAVRAAIERERVKPLRAPVIIAAGIEPSEHPKAIEIEEIAAGAAAIQNMLLAAHSLGLATIWRTGAPAYDPAVKAWLGFSPAAHIPGFIYAGYPAATPRRARHTPASEDTTWRGWD